VSGSEIGMTTFRGGARLGSFNVTWPFARLILSSSGSTLRVLCKSYEIGRDEIHALELHHGLFSKGVRIIHSNRQLPQNAIFWSCAPESVLAAAASHGFRTSHRENER
jgi:hypothetical protein